MNKRVDNTNLKNIAICSVLVSAGIIISAYFFGVLYCYQTLIAGVIALVAALYSVWALWKIEDTKRAEKNNAARAMLSIVLADICEYAQDVLESLYTEKSVDIGEHIEVKNLPKLLSEWSLSQLINAIEYAPKCTIVGKQIAELIRSLQVSDSRLKSKKTTKYWAISMQVAALELYANAEKLFPYSEGTSEDSETVENEDIYRVSRIIMNGTDKYPFEQYFPEAFERLKQKYPPTSPR